MTAKHAYKSKGNGKAPADATVKDSVGPRKQKQAQVENLKQHIASAVS